MNEKVLEQTTNISLKKLVFINIIGKKETMKIKKKHITHFNNT